jgi:hypothetical protein
MADTFSSLNVHCIFSTKNRQPLLVGEIKEFRRRRLLASDDVVRAYVSDELPAAGCKVVGKLRSHEDQRGCLPC